MNVFAIFGHEFMYISVKVDIILITVFLSVCVDGIECSRAGVVCQHMFRVFFFAIVYSRCLTVIYFLYVCFIVSLANKTTSRYVYPYSVF